MHWSPLPPGQEDSLWLRLGSTASRHRVLRQLCFPTRDPYPDPDTCASKNQPLQAAEIEIDMPAINERGDTLGLLSQSHTAGQEGGEIVNRSSPKRHGPLKQPADHYCSLHSTDLDTFHKPGEPAKHIGISPGCGPWAVQAAQHPPGLSNVCIVFS